MKNVERDLHKFDKYGIIYHTTDIFFKKDKDGNYLSNPDYPDRLKKDATPWPQYRDVKLKTNKTKGRNGSIVPMGEVYNLIGIDIDNKDDTLKRYAEICEEYEFDGNTLRIETMHSGFHEYYRLSNAQKEKLKKF